MARKKRFRRSSAQSNEFSYISPASFTKLSQYKEYGLDLDIKSIFDKYTNKDKRFICEVYRDSNYSAVDVVFKYYSTTPCYYILGYTFGGVDYRFNSVGGTFTYPLGSYNRFFIVNCNVNATVTTDNVATDMRCVSIYLNPAVANPYRPSSNTKYIFFTSPVNFYILSTVFANHTNLTGQLTIPSGAGNYTSNDFINATKITSIICLGTVGTLSGFNGCSGLTTVNAGLSNKIGATAFNNCTSLNSLTIGESLIEIGSQAFYGCTTLTSFQVPSNLIPTTGLGGGVISNTNIPLSNVTSLSPIYTVGTSGTVGYGCIFEEVGGVKKRAISAPKTFAGLGGSLDLANYASGLTSIDAYSFYGCTGITSLTLPSGLTSIGRDVFNGCNISGVVTIPDGVVLIDVNAFYFQNKITELILPNSIQTINSCAFQYLNGVTGAITLPTSLISIGLAAFESASVTILNVPAYNNTTTIDRAFRFTNLRTLNIASGYSNSYNTWNLSDKLALTTATADALAQSMINIAAGTASNVKVIHIGAVNKTNLLANGTPSLIATMNANLAANYKQLNASNTTLSVATTGVAITSITVASTAGYLSAGTIMLGATSITYTSITATTFVFTSVVVPAYTVGTVVSEV